ncbi:InlB B-repeat-containing protein [Pseudogracilibacillus sp. SO10305]|uniref:InlB B-repeat-containing protein n=1 Tax=Pseudogracilibacillus sp. SO10305 TaxID=3098292 RepID=UPI00300E5D0C
MGKQLFKKFFAILAALLLVVSSFPQLSSASEKDEEKTLVDVVNQGIYDPNNDYLHLDVRFWEDEKPEVGFYINHANLYNYNVVDAPIFGTSNGEWTVMGLLRGLDGGYYYNDELTQEYFDGYINRVEEYVERKSGNLDRNKSTEWSRSILALSALGYDITNVAGYDYIEKLSESYPFSYRQGINGPIWEIIALNTGPYELYEDTTNENVNTIGKMIDYILDREIEQSDGTIGGWALMGKQPDADITGMALQSLAPYYKDKALFEQTDSTYKFEEFAKAVERAIVVLGDMQLDNGGFAAFGNVNVESTVQVVVALTALGMDPISTVDLPYLGKQVNFVTDGGKHDGVTTNNMVDKLLTFWAPGTTPEKESYRDNTEETIYNISGGFRHVTSGNDGGGGSGYGVNGMATDQSIYGLIAYERFVKGKNDLYDMSDMVNGEYKDMLVAKEQTVTFEEEGNSSIESGKRYGLVEIPEGQDVKGKSFTEWNSKQDGSGTIYEAGELLVVPEKDVTLHAQYENEVYSITYELNDASFISDEIVTDYTIDDDVILPKEEDILKEGYTFEGWFTNASFEGEKVTQITKGSTEDKTFYAKWTEAVNEDEIAGLEVQEMIGNLPATIDVTLDHKEAIEQARLKFDSLSENAKLYVSNVSKLESLETRIVQLEEEVVVDNLKVELETKMNEILQTNLKTITNDSARSLGSLFGQAEMVLRELNIKEFRSVRTISTLDSSNATIDNLKEMINQLEVALGKIEYRDETETEEVVISHAIFEEARLSGYKEELFTVEQQEIITETLEQLNSIIEDESITQDEVDMIVEDVQEKIESVQEEQEEINKEKLEREIERAEEINLDDKTPSSVMNFENALTEAKAALENQNATQEEVDEAANALLNAISELKQRALKDELQEKIAEADNIDLSNKTEESVNSFEDALEHAKTVLEDEEITQDEVDATLRDLQLKIDQLKEEPTEEMVQKEELQNAVNDASSVDLSNKTKQTVEKFKEALNNAKTVVENDQATQEEVNEALALLKQSIKDLKDKETSNSEQGGKQPSKPETKPEKSETEENPGDEDIKEDASPTVIEPSESKSEQAQEDEVEKDNKEHLPNTATTMYTILFIGFILLVTGIALFVSRRIVQSK